MRKFVLAGLTAAALAIGGGTAQAAEEAPVLPEVDWSFEGVFGTFDRDDLRRGFQVYNNVCAGCHSLSLVAYRNLMAIGFSEDEVKEIAAQRETAGDVDDQGEPTVRPALPSDRFVPPFPNEQAARAANNGAFPPDLSLITKARVGGADFTYGVLVGYEEPPAGFTVEEGLYYNAYFPGHKIAMPPPLQPGAVEYPEGVEASVEQMAHDVSVFLSWAAEPKLEQRKRMGVKVILFLLLLTGLLYAVKRKVWASLH